MIKEAWGETFWTVTNWILIANFFSLKSTLLDFYWYISRGQCFFLLPSWMVWENWKQIEQRFLKLLGDAQAAGILWSGKSSCMTTWNGAVFADAQPLIFTEIRIWTVMVNLNPIRKNWALIIVSNFKISWILQLWKLF